MLRPWQVLGPLLLRFPLLQFQLGHHRAIPKRSISPWRFRKMYEGAARLRSRTMQSIRQIRSGSIGAGAGRARRVRRREQCCHPFAGQFVRAEGLGLQRARGSTLSATSSGKRDLLCLQILLPAEHRSAVQSMRSPALNCDKGFQPWPARGRRGRPDCIFSCRNPGTLPIPADCRFSKWWRDIRRKPCTVLSTLLA